MRRRHRSDSCSHERDSFQLLWVDHHDGYNADHENGSTTSSDTFSSAAAYVDEPTYEVGPLAKYPIETKYANEGEMKLKRQTGIKDAVDQITESTTESKKPLDESDSKFGIYEAPKKAAEAVQSSASSKTSTSFDSSTTTLHFHNMDSSGIVALWNALSIQIADESCLNSATEQAYNTNQLDCCSLIQVTTVKLSSFSMEQLSHTIFSIALIVSSLLTRYKKCDLEESLRQILLKQKIKEEVFNLFACEAVKKLHQSDAHNLSNLAYAYASIGYTPSISDGQDFLKVIAKKVVELRSGFSTQDISLILRAYVTTRKPSPIFLKLSTFARFVVDHVVAFIDELHPQEVSKTLWVFAELGIHRKKLFKRLANRIVELDSDILARFTAENLSGVARAFALSKCHHPGLFKLVAQAAIRLKDDFSGHHLATLLWAFATLRIDEQIFVSFAPIVVAILDIAKIHHISIIVWSYAIMDADAPELFNSHFVNQVTLKCKNTSNGGHSLSRLHQWNLWQTKEKMRPGFQPLLQNKCYNSFISQEIQSSTFQSDVVSTLSSIGIVPKEEVLMDSGYSIDAVITLGERTIGIEMDGPHHFIGDSKLPTGSTILKRRQVQSIDGIELISLPHWIWRETKRSTEKQQLLRDLLGLKDTSFVRDTLETTEVGMEAAGEGEFISKNEDLHCTSSTSIKKRTAPSTKASKKPDYKVNPAATAALEAALGSAQEGNGVVDPACLKTALGFGYSKAFLNAKVDEQEARRTEI